MSNTPCTVLLDNRRIHIRRTLLVFSVLLVILAGSLANAMDGARGGPLNGISNVSAFSGKTVTLPSPGPGPGFADPLPYDNDTIIVRFTVDKGLDTVSFLKMADEVHSSIGTSLKEDFTSIGLPGMQVVQLPSGMAVWDAVEKYNANPAIRYAEPNYKRYPTKIPNDPAFSRLYGLSNTGQVFRNGMPTGTSGADISAPGAWDISTGSNGVVVAVIDTGVDWDHPDLSDYIWTNTGEVPGNNIDDDQNGYIDDTRGWDFGDNDNDPKDDAVDPGHGSHCAGTIGAVGNNNIGLSGVAWNLKIMPLKFSDSGGSQYNSAEIKAIAYAKANNATIISCSFGGSAYSQSEKDAIDQASSCLFVAAAGNDHSDNDIKPEYPASYSSKNLIAIASSDENDHLSSFSNYGKASVHVAAPGSTIYSTVPYSFTNLYSDDFSTVSAWNAPTPWGRNTTVFYS